MGLIFAQENKKSRKYLYFSENLLLDLEKKSPIFKFYTDSDENKVPALWKNQQLEEFKTKNFINLNRDNFYKVVLD